MGQPTYEQLKQRVEQLEKEVAGQKGTEATSRTPALPELKLLFQLVFDHLPADANLWELVRDEHGEIRTWRLLESIV